MKTVKESKECRKQAQDHKDKVEVLRMIGTRTGRIECIATVTLGVELNTLPVGSITWTVFAGTCWFPGHTQW